ncbi:hypothetical protein [Shewanella inventionis]|uniref:hypothetical protein n=1 Tax=Shewanella inventionis TaxID=1738770 RepID=UPI00166DF716|nr:hypothetical protein [Shewanella inventionis]
MNGYFENIIKSAYVEYDSLSSEFTKVKESFLGCLPLLLASNHSNTLKQLYPAVYSDHSDNAVITMTIYDENRIDGHYKVFEATLAYPDGSRLTTVVNSGQVLGVSSEFKSNNETVLPLYLKDDVFEVIDPLVKVISNVSADNASAWKLLNYPIKPTNAGSINDLPIVIQVLSFKRLITDYLENGFTEDKVRNKSHLTSMLSRLETRDAFSMRNYISSFSKTSVKEGIVARLYGADEVQEPLSKSLLDNMAILVECIDSLEYGVNVSSLSSMHQILTLKFNELDLVQRIKFYIKATEHPAFGQEKLDSHLAFFLFNKNHRDEINEYKECIYLANIIDMNQENLSNLKPCSSININVTEQIDDSGKDFDKGHDILGLSNSL